MYLLSIAVAVCLVVIALLKPTPQLDRSLIKSMAGDTSNKLAVVTGSTSGIGKQIAFELANLGIEVIMVGRNPRKVEKVINEMQSLHKNLNLKLTKGIMDTSDLISVKNFCNEMIENLKNDGRTIDYLVNNAGIHYVSSNDAATMPSAQGYDMAFATNYLGHFLLVDNLLKYMSSNGRIIQISSGMHMMSDGTMLSSDVDGGIPLAARSDITTNEHYTMAYSNNKLAQILHARELQRLLKNDKNNDIKLISVCPGWVDTNIFPDNVLAKWWASLAFRPSTGTCSALTACFSSDLNGGEFINNSNMFMYNLPFGITRILILLSTKIGWFARCGLVNFLSMIAIITQSYLHGAQWDLPTSPESYNVTLQKNLYQWSKSAIKDYKI